MGQQTLKTYDRKEILNKTETCLLKGADDFYMKKHFLLGKGVDMDKIKHHILMQYALCTPNCEVIEWIGYKLLDALPDQKSYNFDLNPLKPKVNVYNITQYIDRQATWADVQW